MITSAVFYRTLKTVRRDERFEAILRSFPGCQSVKENSWRKCDLAIIQGWLKPGFETHHNLLRKNIIEKQKKNNSHVLTVDGNIFNYMSKNIYFRYSLDGIFANTGYYLDDTIDTSRWDRISKDTGCSLKPWRKTGDHVLILMQKNSGWTMAGKNNLSWCIETVDRLRQYTDRKIVVRLHPTDSHLMNEYVHKLERSGVTISKNKHILEDLRNAWCSITYNSSPGAVSAIEGVPVFIMDPDYKKSPAAAVGNVSIDKIEDPIMIDRTEWIQRIAMSHYSIQDINDGILWNEVSRYFKKLGKI